MTIGIKEKVNEMVLNRRFCYNCGTIVEIEFTNEEYSINTFRCKNCDEVVLTTSDRH